MEVELQRRPRGGTQVEVRRWMHAGRSTHDEVAGGSTQVEERRWESGETESALIIRRRRRRDDADACGGVEEVVWVVAMSRRSRRAPDRPCCGRGSRRRTSACPTPPRPGGGLPCEPVTKPTACSAPGCTWVVVVRRVVDRHRPDALRHDALGILLAARARRRAADFERERLLGQVEVGARHARDLLRRLAILAGAERRPRS